MKKLALLAILIALTVGPVFAQRTATLQIRGIVPESLAISTTLTDTTMVNLRTAKAMIIGSIFINTNSGAGYTVSITSRNGGFMNNLTTGSTDAVPYTLSFGGNEDIDLSSSIQMSFKAENSANLEYPMQVNFPRNDNTEEQLSAGVYEDIIVVSISVV